MSDVLEELREAYAYDTNGWQEIRREAKKDMRFVAGDPWDEEDKKARKNRPTVAPEELSQYRNAVINALMSNPRGARFAPVGNGANDKGAEFYQKKWREIEYRSHASQHYLTAADNALQRSYGFVRVRTDYRSPRDRNQEIWIDGFPNPDMVLPDSDALRLDSSDMKHCFVHRWMPQSDFKRQHPKAKISNFGDFQSTYPDWIQGNKVLVSEYWTIATRPRTLVLVEFGAAEPARQIAPQGTAPQQAQIFADELPAYQARVANLQPVRELRKVDYPEVFMYLTNGLEILHKQTWLGKYIPIVSCYGKVLYHEGDTGMERKILSLTRFMRDPWKSYCYACSQELELLGRVPKATVMVGAGQLTGHTKHWNEMNTVPKPYVEYNLITPATGAQLLNPPTVVPFSGAQELQALEVVKEGFRRAIQSSAGSNFLPTQAQKRNEKSGIALEKIDQMATQGTYHFVYAYNSLIRQTGIIGEDLMDKIYDYASEIGVMGADDQAETITVNTPDKKDAVDTRGDYLVTVSTAPSSDSEREAAADFTDQLVAQIERIAAVAGPKVAAAVLAKSVRMRNLGPLGDQIAELIEPPEFKTKDGQPPSPEMLAAKAQIDHLTGLLRQASQEKEAKVVETQGKFAIEHMKIAAKTEEGAADREVKLAVATLTAKAKDIALFLEESKLVGARLEGAAQRLHETMQAQQERDHQRGMAAVQQQNALEQGAAGHGQALEQQQQAAELAPQPEAGA